MMGKTTMQKLFNAKKQGLGKCGPSVKIYTFLYNNHFLSA